VNGCNVFAGVPYAPDTDGPHRFQSARPYTWQGIRDVLERIRLGERPVIDGDDLKGLVGDLARANLMIMESDVSGEAMNIRGGENTTQKRVVDAALAAPGSMLEPECRQAAASGALAPPKPPLSREKAKRLLNWEPLSVEEGARRIMAWLDQMAAAEAALHESK
jgi:UDP-glucose 4-epimerase